MTLTHRQSRLVPTVLLAAALACHDSTGVGAPARARATPAGVVVHNGSEAPIFYFIGEAGWLALVDWIPCRDPLRCTPVPAGSDRVVPWSLVGGFAPDKHDFIVFWWGEDPHGPTGTLTVRR
jgi:hypothetical protein